MNTTISGNSASGFGGGLSVNGTVSLTNCTISGNTATVGGGGANVYTGSTTMTNCTVSGNQTSGSRAGIIFNFGTLNLRNLTISGNTAANGGGIYHTLNGLLTIRNSIVSANTATTTRMSAARSTRMPGTTCSARRSPARPSERATSTPIRRCCPPLGDYGGPTQTRIPLTNSPAIGAGDNTGGPATDQRGFPRSTGAGGTIGAVDATAFTVTNTNDSGAGSLRQAILDANAISTGDVILFSSFFNTSRIITLASGQLTLTDTATTTITGPGVSLLSVSGGDASRVFAVNLGASAAMTGMTITHGNGQGVGGSGRDGGAIYNAGTLTLTNSTISNSTTIGGRWGAA